MWCGWRYASAASPHAWSSRRSCATARASSNDASLQRRTTDPELRMNTPEELRYTESHEWVRRESDGTLTIGITDHAQAALGDLVYVELPKAGRTVAAGEACAIVESVKAASDVYAPLAGTIVAGNDDLAAKPEAVN